MKSNLFSFWEHVAAFRATLIHMTLSILAGFVVSFAFHAKVIQFLLAPLENKATFILLGPLSGVEVAFKTSFVSGIVLSSPAWLFFLTRFFIPALHTHEKRLIFPFLTLATTLMCLGAWIAYTATLPFVTGLLSHFNSHLGQNAWTLHESLRFVLWLILGHVLCLELFLLLLVLIHFRIIQAHTLKKGRPYAIVAILLLSALVTPPDIVTQLLFATPMLVLYEGALLYAKTKHTSSLKL